MSPRLAADGRDPEQVPENWRDFVDPTEWTLGEEGLPSRRAARVIALRSKPEPAILLVYGHDRDDRSHAWAFTPGGGIMPGESALAAAVRELDEETGWRVDAAALAGPVISRHAYFRFNRVTCRQDEEFFLLSCDDGLSGVPEQIDRSGWTAEEQEVLDDLRWWSLDELDAAIDRGLTVYPQALPGLAREFISGWDGQLHRINED